MRKLRISFVLIICFLFSGCAGNNEIFVRNIKINKIDNLFVVEFQTYDFSSEEKKYDVLQHAGGNLASLCIEAVNEENYNFRLCENIYIDISLSGNECNTVVATVNLLKIPPAVNLVCFIPDMDLFPEIKIQPETPLYNWSKSVDGFDGIMSVIDKNTNVVGAVMIDDGNAVKYLNKTQMNVFNMLTGCRKGFSLLLENIESNIIIDRCDVFYSENRINLTVSVKDYKGISDENLMKSFVKREIEDTVYFLLNDAVVRNILIGEMYCYKLPEIMVKVF